MEMVVSAKNIDPQKVAEMLKKMFTTIVKIILPYKNKY